MSAYFRSESEQNAVLLLLQAKAETQRWRINSAETVEEMSDAAQELLEALAGWTSWSDRFAGRSGDGRLPTGIAARE